MGYEDFSTFFEVLKARNITEAKELERHREQFEEVWEAARERIVSERIADYKERLEEAVCEWFENEAEKLDLEKENVALKEKLENAAE